MHSFQEIFEIAADRKGGVAELEKLLSRPLSPQALAKRPDAEWLSTMAKCVFQAGFNWKIIENKWTAFGAAFDQFDPRIVASYSEDKMDALLADASIVRNGAKLASVQQNAVWLVALAKAHGSAGTFFTDWPDDDLAGLLALMGKCGQRLGGATGQRVLRTMGKDCYVLSPDVVARLIAEGVVDKLPSSQRDMASVQLAFNKWRQESGWSATEISQTLAYSVGV